MIGPRTLAFAALLVAAPAALGGVADEIATDPILDTLAEWTAIGMQRMRLDGAPQPHRVVTALGEITGFGARASFGELLYEEPLRRREGRVEVIVGNDALDSSRFRGEGSRWARQSASPRQRMSVAVERGELALSRDLWASIDASYKRAVQQWRAKVGARDALGDLEAPADWSDAETSRAVDLSPLPAIDEAALRDIAVAASASLRELPGLDEGEVSVNAVEYRFYTVTSEGTRLAQPEGYVAVHARAALRTGSGVELDDELQWVVRHVSDLPPRERIVRRVRELGRSVVRRSGASNVDYYEGPVVFEGRAAAQFFRHLLPAEIVGTPPEPRAGHSYRRQTRSGPRLGRRVLPDGWSVVDDPTAAPEGAPGGYAHDREGVAGKRVVVVEDGYVRDLLMSRVPRADKNRSNGHARGSITGDWMARPSVWQVRPPKLLSNRPFDEQVDLARKKARLDRILVVQRLARGPSNRLPPPTRAVWRYPSGREEPVSALEFQNVDRRTLRGVAAAGGKMSPLPYLAAWEPGGGPDRERGLPTVVTSPDRLLVEDVELVFPGPGERPYAYPPPWGHSPLIPVRGGTSYGN